MTVIPFPCVRFTEADLAAFERVASPLLKRGLWSAVHRDSSPGTDRLVVEVDGLEKPLFTLERHRSGLCRLLLHEPRGTDYEIGRGSDAEACLAIWLRSRAKADVSAHH